MKKFLKGIRGKQVLVSVLALMVIASGVYRWSVSRNEAETVAVTTETLPVEEVKTSGDTVEPEETDFFALSRYERDCARSEAVELLTVSAEFEEENGSVAKKIEKVCLQKNVPVT